MGQIASVASPIGVNDAQRKDRLGWHSAYLQWTLVERMQLAERIRDEPLKDAMYIKLTGCPTCLTRN
jgi:hypothetical protein